MHLLKRLKPIFDATDEFLFGTSKTACSAPFISDRIDVKRYMSLTIIALLPATMGGIYFYGLRVLMIIAVSYIIGGLTEAAFSVIRNKPVYEGFFVTGLIFPLILPPTIPLWMVAVGMAFGVFFGKEVFGGTGRNIFNVALVGRIFLSAAFPEHFATMWQEPLFKGFAGFVKYNADVITSATPLVTFKMTEALTDLYTLFIGTVPGSIGETFKIGIIVGGLFLIVTKIADWRIPLTYILSVLIFAFIGNSYDPSHFAPPMFQILSGSILFGAFFMATDPVTSPLTSGGKWIAGIIMGFATVIIRALSGFVEGVMYAILLMNALAPLIDSIIINIKFKKVHPANR